MYRISASWTPPSPPAHLCRVETPLQILTTPDPPLPPSTMLTPILFTPTSPLQLCLPIATVDSPLSTKSLRCRTPLPLDWLENDDDVSIIEAKPTSPRKKSVKRKLCFLDEKETPQKSLSKEEVIIVKSRNDGAGRAVALKAKVMGTCCVCFNPATSKRAFVCHKKECQTARESAEKQMQRLKKSGSKQPHVPTQESKDQKEEEKTISLESKLLSLESKLLSTDCSLAYALACLSILGTTETEVRYALNAEIDDVMKMLRVSKPETKREECGINDQRWHSQVLGFALKTKYGVGRYHFRKLTLPPTFLPNKRYLIEGVLNRNYMYGGILHEQENHEQFDNEVEGRHCIGLLPCNNSHLICCNQLPLCEKSFLPLEVLHMDANGKITDREQAYMRDFLKVYEIECDSASTRLETKNEVEVKPNFTTNSFKKTSEKDLIKDKESRMLADKIETIAKSAVVSMHTRHAICRSSYSRDDRIRLEVMRYNKYLNDIDTSLALSGLSYAVVLLFERDR